MLWGVVFEVLGWKDWIRVEVCPVLVALCGALPCHGDLGIGSHVVVLHWKRWMIVELCPVLVDLLELLDWQGRMGVGTRNCVLLAVSFAISSHG